MGMLANGIFFTPTSKKKKYLIDFFVSNSLYFTSIEIVLTCQLSECRKPELKSHALCVIINKRRYEQENTILDDIRYNSNMAYKIHALRQLACSKRPARNV